MGPAMGRKHAQRALQTVGRADRCAETEHAMGRRRVVRARGIAVPAPLRAGMGCVTQQKHAVHARMIVAHALPSAAMGRATERKPARPVLRIAPQSSARRRGPAATMRAQTATTAVRSCVTPSVETVPPIRGRNAGSPDYPRAPQGRIASSAPAKVKTAVPVSHAIPASAAPPAPAKELITFLPLLLPAPSPRSLLAIRITMEISMRSSAASAKKTRSTRM